MFVLLAIPLLLSLLLVRYLQRHYKQRQFIQTNDCEPLPRLTQKDHVLGLDTLYESFHHLRQNAYLRLSQRRFKNTGYTWQFTQLGKTIINTAEPENIKAILSTKFSDFSLSSKRAAAFEPLIGHGIFTADGNSWKQSRKLISPSFSKDGLLDLSSLENHVGRMLARLPADGAAVNLQRDFMTLTMDYATEFFFGHTTAEAEPSKISRKAQDFADAFDRGQRVLIKLFALGPLSKLVPDNQFSKDQRIMKNFVGQYVENATNAKAKQAQPSKRRSLLEEISQHTKDPEILHGSMLNLLLAGRDTTASLLGSFWHVVARKPEVWAKLQEEVAMLNGEKPSFEKIKEMKYLNYCMKETLRLFPPVPRNSRTAIRDTVLPTGGGPDGKSPVFVPAGTEVGYQVFTMHRRTDIYGPDAEDFVPERWENKELRPGWGFLPFNGGPRICLGQVFALTEASYVSVRLLQSFQAIETRDANPWAEQLGLTCGPRGGTWVSLAATEAE